MALDTLAQALDIECCWIQTISDRKHKELRLAAERGFNPEMRREIAAMDTGHRFSQQIIGLGHKIIIPDLSNDGLYGLPSFRKTGYKWLVAVPLMTYRAYGILGAASRNRKRLQKDTADLIMTIAGMIATALIKTDLAGAPRGPQKAVSNAAAEVKEEPKPAEKKPAANISPKAKAEPKAGEPKPGTPVNTRPENSPPPAAPPRRESAFHSHARRMESFRRSHK
jgi:signal transduction protein with GAF and PtsI domain